MNTIKFCTRFHCDGRRDRYCCATCFYRERCLNPCLNHPSRCGLEDKAREYTPAVIIGRDKPC